MMSAPLHKTPATKCPECLLRFEVISEEPLARLSCPHCRHILRADKKDPAAEAERAVLPVDEGLVQFVVPAGLGNASLLTIDAWLQVLMTRLKGGFNEPTRDRRSLLCPKEETPCEPKPLKS